MKVQGQKDQASKKNIFGLDVQDVPIFKEDLIEDSDLFSENIIAPSLESVAENKRATTIPTSFKSSESLSSTPNTSVTLISAVSETPVSQIELPPPSFEKETPNHSSSTSALSHQLVRKTEMINNTVYA